MMSRARGWQPAGVARGQRVPPDRPL